MNDHAWIFRVASVFALIVGVYVLFTYDPPSRRWTSEDRANWAADVKAINARLVEEPDEIRNGWWRLADRLITHPKTEHALAKWVKTAPKSLTVERCGEGLVLYRMAQMLGSADGELLNTRCIELLSAFLAANPSADYFHWYTYGMALQQDEQEDKGLAAFRRVDEQLELVAEELDVSKMLRQTGHIVRTYKDAGILHEARHALKRFARSTNQIQNDYSMIREIVQYLDRLADEGEQAAALDGLHQMMVSDFPGRREPIMDWHTLGHVLNRNGLTDRARVAWQEHLERTSPELLDSPTNKSLYNLACFRALAGDRPGAIDALGLAIDRGWRNLELTLRDPDLDPLRADERFQGLLDRLRELSEWRLERSPSRRSIR